MLAVTYYIQVTPSLLMLVALQSGRHVIERLDLRFAVLADPIVVGRARTFYQESGDLHFESHFCILLDNTRTCSASPTTFS